MQTFLKSERLCEKKLIAQVFEKGKSFYITPFKIVYFPVPFVSEFPIKVLITLTTRNFKNATDRNRIKRIIREAYRKNKDQLYGVFKKEEKWAVAIIYTSKNIISFGEVEAKIILILQRLAIEHNKRNE